jgi:hypothetical protein
MLSRHWHLLCYERMNLSFQRNSVSFDAASSNYYTTEGSAFLERGEHQITIAVRHREQLSSSKGRDSDHAWRRLFLLLCQTNLLQTILDICEHNDPCPDPENYVLENLANFTTGIR